MAVAALSTSRLTKDYGGGHGLFDLDLVIHPQQVFGYLGPNGAGKTTTIRCVMGMIRPTSGSAHVFGIDCMRDAVEVKKRVGYLPGDIPQFGGMTGKEIVAYFGRMRGGVDPKRVSGLCDRFDLDLGRRFREYSSGNKQKLGIVLAFMHAPDLLILDEPTSGLDPLNQQEFYRLLREERDSGATVFLSFADGSDIPEKAMRRAEGVTDVNVDDRIVTCTVHGSFAPLLDALHGAEVTNLVSREPSLEEMFLEYYRERSELPLLP
ncbi:MAG: ABC transporter ATP-binding protein [Chloroflexi bacterium]|nr:MAG: ABC transporter ATP-binding protein [Chloroflexota bacterium]